MAPGTCAVARLRAVLALGVAVVAAGSAGAPASAGEAPDLEDLRAQLAELAARRQAAETAAKQAAEGAAAEGWQLRGLRERLATSEAERSHYLAAGAESRRRARALEAELSSKKVGVVEARLDALPHQRAIAGAAGFLGALSVVGPSSYTRLFLSLAGSAAGGLLAASSASVLEADFRGHAEQAPLWTDAALLLLGGGGHVAGYSICCSAVLLGLLRWLLQWDRRPHEVFWPKRGRVITAAGQAAGRSTASA